MDIREGKLELLRSLEEVFAAKEKYPNSNSIFTLNEKLEIKGSRFQVVDITTFGIKLRILPEFKATKDELTDPFERANKCFGSLCSVYEKRISDLETKLRELAEATEWRDEIELFYDYRKNIHELSSAGWFDIYKNESCRIEDAETAYQTTLEAAKKERNELRKTNRIF